MFVDIESAPLHLNLEDAFGLPELPSKTENHVFGPYQLGGESLFWRYNASTQVWSVASATSAAYTPYLEVEPAVHERLIDTMEVLRSLPRPGFCSTPNVTVRGEEFTFNGWRFAWYWLAELGRWELAEHGPA